MASSTERTARKAWAVSVEDQLLAFLREQPLPVSTHRVGRWIEEAKLPRPPRRGGHSYGWFNTDVTARLKALVARGLVERLVFEQVANQEGHYWQAITPDPVDG